MSKTRSLALLVVVAHWITAIWHLVPAAQMLPPPGNHVSGLAVILMSIMHLVVFIAAWRLSDKIAGLVLLVSFVAAMVADIYEHFVQGAPNNIFMAPAGDWTGWFYASVFILLGLEILGCLLGILSLTGRPRTKDQREGANSNPSKPEPLCSAAAAPLAGY